MIRLLENTLVIACSPLRIYVTINSVAMQIGITYIVGQFMYSVTKICDNFSSLIPYLPDVAFIFKCAFVSKMIIDERHWLDIKGTK